MSSTLKLIKKAVGKGMKSARMTKPATLIKFAPGAREAGNVAGGVNPTMANYAARGLVATDEYSNIDGTVVQNEDRVVVLFGALIQGGAVPANGDKITIEGATQPIIAIGRDAAQAAYKCLCRG